jgi:DNA-directed RNA polymerase subunit RPC12/RpoP
LPRKPRARTQRRERERALEKLARDRERLARLETGGSPERPIELESASQVEVHARSMRCTRCEAELRVDEHVARTVGEQRLRLARLVCPRCGSRRDVWFRLAPALPS